MANNESMKLSTKDRLKRQGLKVTAIIALGGAAMGLAGCGPAESKTNETPPPTSSAPVTPGQSESPSSNETPKLVETKTELSKSDIFKELNPSDKATVEKDLKLSYEEFAKLTPRERSLVSIAVTDANIAQYFEDTKNLVIPGNDIKLGEELSSKEYGDFGYTWGESFWVVPNSDPRAGKNDNSAAYNQAQLRVATAFNMALHNNYDDAKKVLDGVFINNSTTHTVDKMIGNVDGEENDNAGNYTWLLGQLDKVHKTGVDDAPFMRFPANTPQRAVTLTSDGYIKTVYIDSAVNTGFNKATNEVDYIYPRNQFNYDQMVLSNNPREKIVDGKSTILNVWMVGYGYEKSSNLGNSYEYIFNAQVPPDDNGEVAKSFGELDPYEQALLRSNDDTRVR